VARILIIFLSLFYLTEDETKV